MVNISEKISSLRKGHNLTQEALGDMVGVSPQAVSKWEKGDSLPDISVIPDICKAFGISADALLGNEGNMTSEAYVAKRSKSATAAWM
jgi:Predicted transcriptional regulators